MPEPEALARLVGIESNECVYEVTGEAGKWSPVIGADPLGLRSDDEILTVCRNHLLVLKRRSDLG